MRDVIPDIDRWLAQGRRVAVATVVQTWGSSPRQPGARLALTPGGGMAGSVSGGCVEGAVFEAGVAALEQGQARHLHFGVADETAWEVGLACGGSLDVLVQPLDPTYYAALRTALLQGEPVASLAVVSAPDASLVGRTLLVGEAGPRWGSLSAELDPPALAAASAALGVGEPRLAELAPGVEAFVDVLLPPLTLIAVGGVHITQALLPIARAVGYRTIVVEPRSAFAQADRFTPGSADQIVTAWPDEALAQVGLTRGTAVAMLTHDPKLDDPALRVALPSPAFYVGALGSRTTQARRRERLLEAGLTEAQLARLHGPIGLDLGARTPAEIALAIMAEIVAARNRNR